MEKKFAKIVNTNVKLVLTLLITVLHVVIPLDRLPQNVNVLQDIMMLDMNNVNNAYQNVTNVKLLTTTVPNVMNQES
jgi:hypothetical protein